MSTFFLRFLSFRYVKRRYVETGKAFGDAMSYIDLGPAGGLKQMLNTWAKWEKEYARRGYRTIPIDSFIDYGGHGKPLKGVGDQRRKNEEPVLYAEICRKEIRNMLPEFDI